MRLPVIGLLLFSTPACSSSEVTTTTAAGSAQQSNASAAKSPTPASLASAATPAASTSGATVMRDAEAELKALDPFNETASDAQRLLTAMGLCGEPSSTSPWGKQSDAPWGKELPDDKPSPTKPSNVSRCTAENHARLYMKSASMLADSKTPENKKTAGEHAYFALALDPKAAPPAGANAAVNAIVAVAQKRPVPGARLGAVTTSDEATKKALETAAAELGSAVRLCYASGLLNNANLQGTLKIEASVEVDGRLSNAKTFGSLPDSGVWGCVTEFANRSKVNVPSRTPTKVNLSFACSPGGK